MNPVTFVAAALVLAVTALLAAYLPARRAARVDALVAFASRVAARPDGDPAHR